MAKKRPWWHYAAVIGIICLVGQYGPPLVGYPGVFTYLLTPLTPPGGEVTLMVQVVDGISDAVFSPADASVNYYRPTDPADVNKVGVDIEPMALIGAGSESPDGEFTSSATGIEGEWVYIYTSGTNYYTKGVWRQVPYVLHQGITTEAVLESIKVYPNTGPLAADVSLLITTGGVEKDNSTNFPTGVNDYRIEITATSAYAFGNEGYIDPETGYWYQGGFLVFDLDLTTARGEITSSDLLPGALGHFTISSHEYWVFHVGQVVNDDDISGDGTKIITLTLDNQVAAANCLDIGIYVSRRPSYISSASFGTNYEADSLTDVHFA